MGHLEAGTEGDVIHSQLEETSCSMESLAGSLITVGILKEPQRYLEVTKFYRSAHKHGQLRELHGTTSFFPHPSSTPQTRATAL